VTWTKTGTEFPGDCAAVELSDAAYRTHHEVIQWMYDREEYSCRIPKTRAMKITESMTAEPAMRELVAVGFWRDHGSEYEVVHQSEVIRQSLASQHLKRTRDKKAQAAHRRKQTVSADVSAESAATQTDRQTDKHLEASEYEPCEHGVQWGCLKCKANERKGA
jgi:hypothetical protein